MGKIEICIIGAGNISNTRHIPALMKNKMAEIVGVISDKHEQISRTFKNYKFLSSKNLLLLNKTEGMYEQLKECEWFMKQVDAVVIGTPPKQHYPLVKACLMLKKHVLVEKPMMMNVEECDDVLEIAKQNKLILNVMHSFQFSCGMKAMSKRYAAGEFGEIQSILELQLSNRNRRLPKWYNELPLGLFYDEAAHFFYSAHRFGGALKVINAHAAFNDGENTPRFLEVQLTSGNIPVQMYMNFNSPICEWGLLLICDKKIAIYDYFKDILIVLKNDNLHLAKDILRNSLCFTLKFWIGFIKNGFKMLSHKLLYGHEDCMNIFISSILSGETCYELSADLGREVVIAMNEVVMKAENEKR